MRLGYSVGSLGTVGVGLDEQVGLVQEAERLGYESAWVAEAYGGDPVGMIGWLAAQTSRIGLGTGVLQIPARTPVAAAMSAATLDQVSGGRFRLGIGASGPQVVEGRHGVAYGSPLVRTREYTAVLRMALNGEEVRFEGETLSLPLAGGQGVVTKLGVSPVQERLPIYHGAMGPRAVELAGEAADGWLAMHCPPEYVASAREWLERGAARAGRSLDGFRVVPMVLTHIEDDPDAARDAMRPLLALYLGGMGSRRANFYNRLAGRLGYGAQALAVQEAFLDGRQGDALDLLPDGLIDAMTVCGPPEAVRDRLDAYRAAGAHTLVAGLVTPTAGMRREQLGWLAELASD